jgi:malate dehydrogenase
MNRKKIAFVGAGQIGGTAAMMAAERKLGDIALIDANEGLAAGKALDISHAAPIDEFEINLTGGSDYALMKDADVVVVTAGKPRLADMSRDELLESNVGVIQTVALNIKNHAPNAFVIVVTNPLDATVWAMQKISCLPPFKVVGMAGALDSARFRLFLSQEFKVSPRDVSAMVIGAHGDTMVPLIHSATVGGIPLPELVAKGKMTVAKLEAIVERTKKSGFEIVELMKKGSAYFAPSAAILSMAESYLFDQKRVIPCAAYANGPYGLNEAYIGVPCVIGGHGVERVVEIDLAPEERAAFEVSLAGVEKLIEKAKALLEV